MPGIPGGFELIILAFIVLLLFGKRIPGAMRSLGQSITEFKKGVSDTSKDENSSTPSETPGSSEA
ncbi:MAG: twin-arginine translocase TatA/TatE family subunit [Planctomycetaceae bacterium]|nr:twin-arginine translocase TatA/TatE family subunit [Planctomycetaceae bacterium]